MNSFTKKARTVAAMGLGTAVIASGMMTAVSAQTDEQIDPQEETEFQNNGRGPGFFGKRFHPGMRDGAQIRSMPMGHTLEQMGDMHEAFAHNDYDAWVEAMSELPNVHADALTQENFDTLVEAHELHEQARELQKSVFEQIHPRIEESEEVE